MAENQGLLDSDEENVVIVGDIRSDASIIMDQEKEQDVEREKEKGKSKVTTSKGILSYLNVSKSQKSRLENPSGAPSKKRPKMMSDTAKLKFYCTYKDCMKSIARNNESSKQRHLESWHKNDPHYDKDKFILRENHQDVQKLLRKSKIKQKAHASSVLDEVPGVLETSSHDVHGDNGLLDESGGGESVTTLDALEVGLPNIGFESSHDKRDDMNEDGLPDESVGGELVTVPSISDTLDALEVGLPNIGFEMDIEEINGDYGNFGESIDENVSAGHKSRGMRNLTFSQKFNLNLQQMKTRYINQLGIISKVNLTRWYWRN